jgi:OmcA/MtrC family decaheme c-type cytochrome
MERKMGFWFKPLLACLLFAVLALAGCEGDTGPQGPPGLPGLPGGGVAGVANESCSVCHGPGGIRDIEVVHPEPIANNLTFGNFSVVTTDLTAVAVSFSVAGPGGPITDDPEVNFSGSLTFAKLVPGAGAGDRSSWQSYINRVEIGDVGPVEGEPAVLAQAVQATSESTAAGSLTYDAVTDLWTYVFAFNFSAPAEDIDGDGTPDVPAGTLDFAADLQNRISGQFSANEVAVGDNEIIVQTVLEGNPVFDFVPDGTLAPATRNIAVIASCNECHRELALHGGHRFEVEYCVTCHNPGTVDANSGNTVDLTALIHKIHRGESLPSVENGDPYVIVGYRDAIHDYSTVVWPGFPIGEPLDCAKCHTGADAATPDGDNWILVPTMEACGTCHDDISFTALTGTEPSWVSLHTGGAQADNSSCVACHPSAGIILAHEVFQLTASTMFAASIDTVATAFDPVTRQLEVVFSILDPTNVNTPWNILADVPFTQGSASTTSILVGWDPQELHNSGSNSVPAQPIRINALTNAVDNLDGTFSVTATIPAGINSVRVAIEGHPAVEDPSGTFVRVPMVNAFADVATGAVPTDRRDIVDINKCNACHGTLSLHGNNRTNEIGVCVICHNANATDIEVRPATLDTTPADGIFDNFAAAGVDGKREEAIDFKRMIHSIHAGGPAHGFRETGVVIYGFGRSIHDYSEVRYPTGWNNCDMCHIAGPPNLPVEPEVLGTTIRTADPALDGNQGAIDVALINSADDLNISPTAAACSGCHDGGQIQSHMESNGANFNVLQENIQ